MASTYIDIPGGTSRLATMLRNLVDQARLMQDTTTKLVDILTIAKDAPEDVDTSFVTIAAKLGITSAEARQVFNMLNDFQTVINKANYDTFVNRLG